MRACIVAISLAFVLAGCGETRWGSSFELDEANFDAEAMEMVRKDSGLVIPRGARGIRFAYKPPIDPAFLAIIEIPESDREQVIHQIEAIKADPISSSGGLEGLEEKTGWWQPTKGEVLIDREHFDTSNGRSRRAVLTRQDGKLLLHLSYST